MNASQRRRILPVIFIGAAVVVVLLFSRHQPLTIDAEYRLGADRAGIVELGATWRGDGGKTTHASFNYRGRKVPRAQSHQVELPPGHYEVTLSVERDDGTVSLRTHEITLEDAGTMEFAATPE